MYTKNPGINVTFEETTSNLLAYLALQEQKSVEKLVRELTFEALEMHEDLHLSKVTEKLDQEGIKTYDYDEA